MDGLLGKRMRTLILLSLGAVPSQLFRWFVRRPEAPPGTRSRLGERLPSSLRPWRLGASVECLSFLSSRSL